MGAMQRMILRLMPKKWAEEAEAESRQWMMRCGCGAQISVWDAGGVRWKGGGKPRALYPCKSCGKNTWHDVVKAGAS
ncbi:MAG TPA: hypothetical protein VGE07_26815 [Herpetosiphonaceae bacterium]